MFFSRREAGRLSLKLVINVRILQFCKHLENLPANFSAAGGK